MHKPPSGRDWRLIVMIGLAGLPLAPLQAQAGAYQSVFGFTPPVQPARPAVPQDQSDDGKAPATGSGRDALGRPGAAGASSATPEIPRELQEQLWRRLSPPAGTDLTVNTPVARSVGRRLGASVVQPAAAGTRLGGGYSYPSPEAVAVDPRDALDAKARSLSDPRGSAPR